MYVVPPIFWRVGLVIPQLRSSNLSGDTERGRHGYGAGCRARHTAGAGSLLVRPPLPRREKSARGRPGQQERLRRPSPGLVYVILIAVVSVILACGKAHAQGAIVKSEFIFTHAPFPSCHASTIVQTKDGLVSAWFGGTRERAPDVGIWLSRDVDTHWTPPVEVANGMQSPTLRYPCWNPVLFQPRQGPLLLFYKVGPKPSAWWGMMMTSKDCGKTWSKPHRLPDGILGPIKDKPVQLANGDILAGSSDESHGRTIHFERLRIGPGTTHPGPWTVVISQWSFNWKSTPPVPCDANIGPIQPCILFHRDGRLQALGRTKVGKIFQTWSSDDGKTWSKITLTSLPNPDSGIDAVTLMDGRQLLVYNHNIRSGSRNKGRSPLNVAISPDGRTWYAALVLEDDSDAPNGFPYPAVIQTSDGLVRIVYTWERKRIKYVVLDPSKLKLRPIVNGIWPE